MNVSLMFVFSSNFQFETGLFYSLHKPSGEWVQASNAKFGWTRITYDGLMVALSTINQS